MRDYADTATVSESDHGFRGKKIFRGDGANEIRKEGVVGGAVKRVDLLAERIGQIDKRLSHEFERVLGAEPESDGDSCDEPSGGGDAMMLARALSHLETAISRLNTTADRAGRI